MPFQSQKQAGAMFSAAAGNSTLGIPKSVGQDFVNASKGMSVSKLPKKTGKPFSKASHHHAKIGAALKAGDGKTAMKHTGHMMLAIRAGMNGTPAPSDNDGDESQVPAPAPAAPAPSAPSGLLARLRGLRSK
jgi:hypothetical protein